VWRGAIIAIECNAVRTLVLTIVAAKEGSASIANSPEKAEAAFHREIVKLVEVKTNGLVDHATTR
jgi:hypothetical protein